MANYDPDDVIVNYKGHIIKGFAAGTFVVVEPAADTFTKSVGSDGKVTRVRNRDSSGTVTITLQAESPSNTVLAASHRADMLNGAGEGPLLVTNLRDVGIAATDEAWVRRIPNQEFADTASNRVWILDCSDLESFVAGALDA